METIVHHQIGIKIELTPGTTYLEIF